MLPPLNFLLLYGHRLFVYVLSLVSGAARLLEKADSYHLSYSGYAQPSNFQEDITNPGTFIGIQAANIVTFELNSSSVTSASVLIPRKLSHLSSPSAIAQINDSILIADYNLRCVKIYHRQNQTVNWLCGQCSRDLHIGSLDGTLQTARLIGPKDMFTSKMNFLNLYVLDGGFIKLIDITLQTVTTLLSTSETSLFVFNNILPHGSGLLVSGDRGIISLDANFIQTGFIAHNVTTTRLELDHRTYRLKHKVNVSKPYSFSRIVPLLPDLLLAVTSIDTLNSRLVLIDMTEEKFKPFCDAYTCEDKFAAPGYIIRIKNTLFMTATPYNQIQRRKLDVGSWKISGKPYSTQQWEKNSNIQILHTVLYDIFKDVIAVVLVLSNEYI